MSKSVLKEMQRKSLNSSPDEIVTFENGRVDIAKVGDTTIGRGYFEPGWSWEKSIKPIAKTDSCQLPHTHYVISGRLKVSLMMVPKRSLEAVMLHTFHLDIIHGLSEMNHW